MNLNISRYVVLNYSLPTELAEIVDEVKRSGFYCASLNELVPNTQDREEQMYMALVIANKSKLKVIFNLEKNLCIFE